MGFLRQAMIGLAVACGWLAAPAVSHAQVSCSVNYTTLAFGTIDVLPGNSFDSAGQLSTSCTGITGTTRVLLCFKLTAGTYPLSGGMKQMGSGANRLLFQIYQDAARTTVWNDTTGIMAVQLTSGAPSAIRPTYGRVAGGQQIVPPGSYSTVISSPVGGVIYTGTPPACSTLGTLATFNFTTTATVTPACTVTATNLNFGTTSFFTANMDQTSTVNVTCTNSTPYNVRLNGGTTGATNPALRKMTLGGNQITYGLYRNAPRTQVWGATDGVNTVAGTGTAASIHHTVHGRIPPQASVPPGTYMDTIIVTVAF